MVFIETGKLSLSPPTSCNKHESQYNNIEQKTQSRKHRAENTEQKTQSRKHRAENTEQKTQSRKHRAENIGQKKT